MPDLSANRTLVKSPPELWSEVSEVESLARHLGEFGEIAISRLEPEHTVAWEGEHARGTVELKASGWGTKVTLSAELAGTPTEAGDEPVADEPFADEPVAEEPTVVAPVAEEPAVNESVTTPRESWLRRWMFRQRRAEADSVLSPQEASSVHPEPVPPEPLAWYEPEPEEEQPEADEPNTGVDATRAQTVLEEVLDNLGSAHHRPFSREG